MAVEILRFAGKWGPIRWRRVRLVTHWPPQRIVIGFVQALDFAAVKALIPDLQVRAEGFGCAQVLNGITKGLAAVANRRYFVWLPFAG